MYKILKSFYKKKDINYLSHPFPWSRCLPKLVSLSGCDKSNSNGSSSNETTNAALSIKYNEVLLTPREKYFSRASAHFVLDH